MRKFDILWSIVWFVCGGAFLGGAYLARASKAFGHSDTNLALCISLIAAAFGALILALEPLILKYEEEIRWFISGMLIELGWE